MLKVEYENIDNLNVVFMVIFEKSDYEFKFKIEFSKYCK